MPVREKEGAVSLPESSINLGQIGVVEAAELIRRRQLSPVELVRHYLDQVATQNPSLNVYLTVMEKEA